MKILTSEYNSTQLGLNFEAARSLENEFSQEKQFLYKEKQKT